MSSSNPIKRLFFWLSSAGTETLDQCPDWEQRKYVAFGATVLVPSVFAFIACAYALSTLTENPGVIYPVAAVWAFIILTIDRALLASYRPYLGFFRKMSQFTLRFVVAMLMGLTIAHPLVLLLFSDTIHTVIEKEREVEMAEVRSRFDVEKTKARTELASIEQGIAGQRELWDKTFQAEFVVKQEVTDDAPIAGLTPEQNTELKAAIEESTAPVRARLTANANQAAELTPAYTKIQGELASWQAEFEREVNGQRSGIVGLGPRAKSIQEDQLAWRREETRRLGALLEHLSSEKSSLETQSRQAEQAAIATFEGKLASLAAKQQAEEARVTALRQKVESDQASQFADQQSQLRGTIKQQIDARLTELERMQGELASVANEEAERLAALKAEPRRDILTQTLALHGLFGAGSEGGQFAFYTYLILTLLFMLVDTIPLIVKFFCRPGPYDTLLDRDEVRFSSEHQSFLKSNARYMDQLTAGNLVAVTRNKPLEHALVDGVEHTRAAREFLDSIIELEKSFHEKLRLEELAAQEAAPEKQAILEAIKKQFYDDMQLRMTQFFSQNHRSADFRA
ncbi:DUF4407 domain-containing protein [Phragmitibacter flavus]|uniref:DUF4407 domain-containing protein n=1 Tax=Phragmitibacter flavus TaxID=2576071 RepID=A0A5R8KDJ7_9BACT|nr:DUF4407 domain-containing protein [Phragmitibacter flavus]TLD70382.1 DUF4407 domain-containing protein [Phragmitibacter flavus]